MAIETKKSGSMVATGVQYVYKGQKYNVKANKEVIVAGGAINSPQILLLSGIGPKKQLDQFSIPVLVDNPAVGANLDDHIAVYLEYRTNSSGQTDSHLLHTWYGHYKALAKYYLFGTGQYQTVPRECLRKSKLLFQGP